VVRCDCGHEFGDYRVNWKEQALVYERDPRDERVYRGAPGRGSGLARAAGVLLPRVRPQLDVEMVPKGYPFVFNFLPDLEGDDGE
jgi:acetone carboxylase gamma subunit